MEVAWVPLDIDDAVAAGKTESKGVAIPSSGIVLPVVDVMSGDEVDVLLLFDASRDSREVLRIEKIIRVSESDPILRTEVVDARVPGRCLSSILLVDDLDSERSLCGPLLAELS